MSEPIGDAFEEGGRGPEGLEVDFVNWICGRRAAETEATALRNRLLALGYSRPGLAAGVAQHREKLKREVVGRG